MEMPQGGLTTVGPWHGSGARQRQAPARVQQASGGWAFSMKWVARLKEYRGTGSQRAVMIPMA